MPEGHTIFRMASDHRRWLAGQTTIVLSPQGRFQSEADRLSGSKLVDVDSHGKHLFYRWSGNRVVHIHLGLYGKFKKYDNPSPQPRGAVRMRVIGREITVDLNGPNQCDLISPAEALAIRGRLGEDPIKEDADPEKVWSRIQRSRKTIGAALLDQGLVAGIGNIYRAEILFICRIHPERLCSELTSSEFESIWNESVQLLRLGAEKNRIMTVRAGDPLSARDGGLRRFHVYKQSECPACRRSIFYWQSANRTIYACDACQG